MSYWDQATLAWDNDFMQRVAACVSNENYGGDPQEWAMAHRWEMAATPGFADAYASAVASGVENPGRDPGVITDPQVLSAVQAVLSGGNTR